MCSDGLDSKISPGIRKTSETIRSSEEDSNKICCDGEALSNNMIDNFIIKKKDQKRQGGSNLYTSVRGAGCNIG